MKKKNIVYLSPYQLLALLAIVIGIFYFFVPNLSKLKVSDTQEVDKSVEVVNREFNEQSLIDLPSPSLTGKMSVEQALYKRRSKREFLDKPVTLKQVSQMLWSAQGVTTDWGGRTSPSAKSAYPLTVYVIAKNVDGLEKGVYQYIPGDLEPVHQLGVVKKEDVTEQTNTAAGQASTESAPVVFVITGNNAKMAAAFDNQPRDANVVLEVGHAAQNMHLQAESLGLGMVVTGGFKKPETTSLLNLPEGEIAHYWIPLGYAKN